MVACQNQTNTENNDSESPEATGNKYKLTPFTASQEFPDAKIGMMTYINGVFNFDVSGSTYKLGEQTSDAEQKMCANSAQGQHIHVILDNGPYQARYTSRFDDLELKDGDYYLLAFLSRSYHESIKTKDAFTAQYISVQDKTAGHFESINEPMLFYSRPKGAYVGEKETKKVMLDFYVINLELGKNYKVLADINGEVHTIDTWQPYYIEGLPMGKNKIKLTLVDRTGKMVETPLNPVEREFELKADELEK